MCLRHACMYEYYVSPPWLYSCPCVLCGIQRRQTVERGLFSYHSYSLSSGWPFVGLLSLSGKKAMLLRTYYLLTPRPCLCCGYCCCKSQSIHKLCTTVYMYILQQLVKKNSWLLNTEVRLYGWMNETFPATIRKTGVKKTHSYLVFVSSVAF